MQRKFIIGSFLIASLFGCGGGGGGSSPGAVTDPLPEQAREGTATFSVDVRTGQVTVTPHKPSSRAVFGGSAVSFQASTLLDEPGNTGRKVIDVKMRNNLSETIGGDPSGTATGLRVFFTSFSNVSSTSDIRSLTSVSTLTGASSFGFADGPLSSALFKSSARLVAAADGSVYVADSGNHRIREIKDSMVRTFAGTGVAGFANGSAASARFNFPSGVDVDSNGNLYIAERDGLRIRRVSAQGVVSTVAGTGSSGATNGSGSTALFTSPGDLKLAADGSIYVCDGTNGIRRIAFNGGDPRLAANYTVSSFYSDGSFYSSIAFDSLGVLYAGTNTAIVRIMPGKETSVVAGSTSGGYVDGTGNISRFRKINGLLMLNDGALLISDAGSSSNTIRQMVLNAGAPAAFANNWSVRTVAGSPPGGTSDGSGDVATFLTPTGLALAGSDVLILENHRIRRMTAALGLPVQEPSGSGGSEAVVLANPDGVSANGYQYMDFAGPLSSGEMSSASRWQFVIPEGVSTFTFTVLVEGNTEFIAGLAAVTNTTTPLVGSPQNYVRTFTGLQVGNGFANGTLSEARFASPQEMDADSHGNIYVADRGNHSIRIITPDGRVSTVAGRPTLGSIDGPGGTATLAAPSGVACNDDGTILYVATQFAYSVRRIDFVGTDRTNANHWSVSTIAGASATPGYVEGFGSNARFQSMYDVATNSSGSLVYVSEYGGHRIRKVAYMGGNPADPNNWIVSLLAGSTTGASGYSDGTGNTALFSNPVGIALSAGGDVYVADQFNNRIRKINSAGVVTTFAGGSAHGDGQGTAAGFNLPHSVVCDQSGYIYVGTFGLLRRVSPSGKVETVAGISDNTTGNDGNGATATFDYITGMAIGPSGDLYLTNFSKSSIKRVSRILSR